MIRCTTASGKQRKRRPKQSSGMVMEFKLNEMAQRPAKELGFKGMRKAPGWGDCGVTVDSWDSGN